MKMAGSGHLNEPHNFEMDESQHSMHMTGRSSFAQSLNGDITVDGQAKRNPQVKFDQPKSKSKRRNSIYRKVTTEDGITIVSTKTAKQRSSVRVKSVEGQMDLVDNADEVFARKSISNDEPGLVGGAVNSDLNGIDKMRGSPSHAARTQAIETL